MTQAATSRRRTATAGAFAWNIAEQQAAAFWQQFAAWAAAYRVVSTFARLSLFPGQQLPFVGEVAIDRLNIVRSLDLEPDQLWRDFEHKVRKNVNCAKRSAITVEVDACGRRIDDFLAVYYSTLERRAASDGYFFSREFFQCLMRDLPGQFAFFHVLEGSRVVSTELVLVSADHLYSFLGGTLTEAFAHRPNDLLKYEVMLWGRQMGKRAFVLGGGYAGEDGIFRYKKSFAPQGATPFFVGRQIHDTATYARLLERRRCWELGRNAAWMPASGFFPQYRAPGECDGSHLPVPAAHVAA